VNWRRYSRWWLLALLLAFGVPAVATQFLPLSIEELTARAQIVVMGRVSNKTCQRDAAGQIFTRVELDVSEVWKGNITSNRCSFVYAGGVLGDRKVGVSGQPEYTVGEEMVVFLVMTPKGEAVTLGLAHGTFEVRTDSATGEKYARNIFHGGPPTTSAPGPGVKLQNVPAAARLTVGDLKRRVKGAGQ
jgi:hypothetical protein